MVRADLPVETAQPPPAGPWACPTTRFEQRRPLRGQITKSEVRAVSLYALQLRPDSLVWDIGAGTGSVAVEAARIAHAGCVYAIDKDADSADLLRNNVARYGDGRVSVVIGTAPDASGPNCPIRTPCSSEAAGPPCPRYWTPCSAVCARKDG